MARHSFAKDGSPLASSAAVSALTALRSRIESVTSSSNLRVILEELSSFPMDVHLLQATRIGKAVSDACRDHCDPINAASGKALVRRWREIYRVSTAGSKPAQQSTGVDCKTDEHGYEHARTRCEQATNNIGRPKPLEIYESPCKREIGVTGQSVDSMFPTPPPNAKRPKQTPAATPPRLAPVNVQISAPALDASRFGTPPLRVRPAATPDMASRVDKLPVRVQPAWYDVKHHSWRKDPPSEDATQIVPCAIILQFADRSKCAAACQHCLKPIHKDCLRVAYPTQGSQKAGCGIRNVVLHMTCCKASGLPSWRLTQTDVLGFEALEEHEKSTVRGELMLQLSDTVAKLATSTNALDHVLLARAVLGRTVRSLRGKLKRREAFNSLSALRAWRASTARKEHLEKPHFVLTEAVLLRIVEAMPRSLEELRAIKGIGPAKAERYGASLLDALKQQ